MTSVKTIAALMLALLIGTLAAYGLVRGDFPGRAVVQGLALSPLMVPEVITALGLLYYFHGVGLIDTVPGLWLAHSIVALPFVVRAVMVSAAGLDPTLERAAASLGASLATNALADITIGVSIALTGPTSALGIPTKNGIALWPKEIAGEKLNVIVVDDATDPATAVKNTRKFITEDKVDLIVGSVATPVAAARSRTTAPPSRRAWSSSTPCTRSRPTRPATWRCAGTARPASAGRARRRSTASRG